MAALASPPGPWLCPNVCLSRAPRALATPPSLPWTHPQGLGPAPMAVLAAPTRPWPRAHGHLCCAPRALAVPPRPPRPHPQGLCRDPTAALAASPGPWPCPHCYLGRAPMALAAPTGPWPHPHGHFGHTTRALAAPPWPPWQLVPTATSAAPQGLGRAPMAALATPWGRGQGREGTAKRTSKAVGARPGAMGAWPRP